VQATQTAQVDFCLQVAVKQRKLNTGKFGKRGELLKNGRRKTKYVIESASESDDDL